MCTVKSPDVLISSPVVSIVAVIPVAWTGKIEFPLGVLPEAISAKFASSPHGTG